MTSKTKEKRKAKRGVTIHEIFDNKHVLSTDAKAMLNCVLDNAKRLISNGTISDMRDVGILAGHLKDIVYVATGMDNEELFEYGCNGDSVDEGLFKELQKSDSNEFPWDEILRDHLKSC